jgi:general secretion pathway protein K
MTERRRQRGVAVVTALLLTTLAVTIVASLFWQQQVQVRWIENQRLRQQTKWVLRSALDWARLILREDARLSQVDHLGEPWATSLADTPLDEFVENGRADTEATNATMSGSIVDAQSRYNLRNLAQNAVPNQSEIAVFQRLLSILKLDPNLAQTTADALAATQNPAAAETSSAPAPGKAVAPPAMASVTHNDDLLTIPGYSKSILDRLNNFVVILPEPTAVNVNTASAEVLAARMGIPLSDGGALIAGRAHAYFKDTADFESRAQGKALGTGIATQTHYFFVNGKVQMDRAYLEMQALIYRKDTGNTTIKWLREY